MTQRQDRPLLRFPRRGGSGWLAWLDGSDLRGIVSARTYCRRMTFEDLDPDLLWEPMWVGRPAGTHFSAGGTSPLARSDDTNKLETQAVFGGPVDEGEGDSGL